MENYSTMTNSINKKLNTKITILSLFILLFPLVANSYKPDYNLAISCGSSTTTTALDNRVWVGENEITDNTNLFSFIEPKQQPDSLLNAETPYTTARISLSNFTYSIPNITVSPVFIRLHFYPTSYQNFEPSNALFSVQVSHNLTLLNNFNPLLSLHGDGEDKIIKEYCIHIEPNENLNITFIPRNTKSSPYYAFINGIEIVSMPSFLYYTNLSDTNYYINYFESDNNQYQIRKDKALETVYRVSVGGSQVAENDDTGMFRNWDSDFSRYLEKRYPESEPSDFGNPLNYLHNTIPNYTAPETVYKTARSYGNTTENYNVTWNFEVDSGFTYMVRLHFCEIDYQIMKPGDRVFQIFIDDVMAEQAADVIRWSGAPLVPVHRDYAVIMNSQIGRINLSIKLQREPKPNVTKYLDVLLNGIEIFKVSDGSYNLAGLNPKPLSPEPHALPKSKKSIVVGVSCFLLLAFVVVGIVFWLRKRVRNVKGGNWLKTKNGGPPSLPPHLCRYFTITEIKAATNNFDEVSIIGVGGFGNVYKGFIDRSTPVAIKRLKQGSQQGANEFMNEIELLSQLRHIHLVSLVGYCNDDTEMILVYEFMHRGTLCEHLYGSNSNNQPLPWNLRLEILLGAARGLNYLHAEVKNKIIHRDVKSTNILLDEKWVAKVSDFGLSKIGPSGISTTHVSTMVKGSLGYLDPEYYLLQRLTLKSDVYSFGVVLLEALCARPPLVRDFDRKTASLVGWFQSCIDEGVAIEQIVDPFLKDSITSECSKCYCNLALSCLHDDGTQRPAMSQVVGELELALQLVMSEEDGTHMKGSQFSQSISGEDSCLHFTRSHTYKEGLVSARPSAHEHFFHSF